MKTYNYLESVIEENKIVVTSSNREEVEQELNDTFDSVTGNASGSYTFSAWQAEENLCHNFELLTDALEELRCRGLRRFNTLLSPWTGNFGGIGRNRNRKRNGGVNYENLYYRWMQRNVFNVARSKETYMVGLYAKGMYYGEVHSLTAIKVNR